MKIILDLCGGTGSWSKPYKQAGYDVRLITLPYENVLTYIPPNNVHGILAAPPCTAFSRTGKRLKSEMYKQMNIVNACIKIIENCKPEWWALENPVGYLMHFLGKPKLIFQPYYYGDGWTKKTAIWGNFNTPLPIYNWNNCPKTNLPIRAGRKKPSLPYAHKNQILQIPQMVCFKELCKTDADARAITPPGFAKYFFEYNK